MRILFIARHFTYFRNYDAVIRELASRGHSIHLAVERHESIGGRQAVEALAREYPQITLGEVPSRNDGVQADVIRRVRLGLDYVRYQEPFYDHAPLLRLRARERTPLALARLVAFAGRFGRRVVARLLHDLDRSVPPPAPVVDYLRQQRPDVLLITPLVDLGSQQIDFLRAARQLGIPTALAIWSWDHLSSKAYIRECPERVLVWNDVQRREAVEIHGLPSDRIVVTGAQCFDHWFDRRPSRTRETFCAELGLPPDRPLVLYVCSGLIMGSPPEAPFVREWLQRVRGTGDPRLAAASVLVRPHPTRTAEWQDVDFRDLGPVAIWGGNPVDQQTRADYFDSLYHSAAVVGVNTSAFIEAGIVGRPVLAILPPIFHDNHEGTVHFRYLLDIGGGLLRVSRDLDAHLTQLAAALGEPASADHPHRAFLEGFVRPAGLAQPATPVFVRAVEQLRDQPVAGATAKPVGAWTRAVLGWLTGPGQHRRYARWRLSPREYETATQRYAHAHQKSRARAEARRSAQAAERARKAEAEQAERERKSARAAVKTQALLDKRARADAERKRATPAS